jgi:hypothetical protein
MVIHLGEYLQTDKQVPDITREQAVKKNHKPFVNSIRPFTGKLFYNCHIKRKK